MSLREKLIEAGARAIAEGPYPELSPDFVRTMRHRRAAAALDAFLDCLAENADEWKAASYETVADADPDVFGAAALAVLRESSDG